MYLKDLQMQKDQDKRCILINNYFDTLIMHQKYRIYGISACNTNS